MMRQTWQELPAAATSPQPQQESENLTILDFFLEMIDLREGFKKWKF